MGTYIIYSYTMFSSFLFKQRNLLGRNKIFQTSSRRFQLFSARNFNRKNREIPWRKRNERVEWMENNLRRNDASTMILYTGTFAIGLILFSMYRRSKDTVEISGRKRYNIVHDSLRKHINNASEKSYQEEIAPLRIRRDDERVQLIRNIAFRLLIAAERNPREWRVVVVNMAIPNAFAMPNKIICVTTGLIDLLSQPEEGKNKKKNKKKLNESQIATVIGHELAHVICRHHEEKITKSLFTYLMASITATIFGVEDPTIAQGFGVHLVSAHNSQKMEIEADEVGLTILARACYDPEVIIFIESKFLLLTILFIMFFKEATEVWKLMQKWEKKEGKGNGGVIEQLFSTHPSSKDREINLKNKIPMAMNEYENAGCCEITGKEINRGLDPFLIKKLERGV